MAGQDASSAPIPFAPQQATGLDELAGAGREAFNVVIDAAGSVRRRPGIEQWSTETLPSEIQAIHATVSGRVYALSGIGPVRDFYRVTPTGATHLPGIDLIGDLTPCIAETESVLVFAAGNAPVKLRLDTEVTSNLGGPPPQASHVIAQSSRLLMNDTQLDKTKVYYSSPALGSSFAGFEEWNGAGSSGFFTAESRPDPVVAIAENTNEAFVFGTTTVQVWSPNERTVFFPTSTREHGLIAPYSLVKVEQTFFYLDHRRRFVLGDGREAQVISQPIQRTLDEMETVADCIGFRVQLGPVDAVCWHFPTDGRTFVFQKEAGWGQWSGWLDPENNLAPLTIRSATHNPLTNESLVGLEDGKVGVFKTAATTDLGARIIARVTTGFINRGTDSRKHCQKVRIAMRRGESVGSGDGPQAWLKWRDRPGDWEASIPIALGNSADREIVLEFPSLGVYRRREWQFEFSGTDDLVLTAASEEFEVLGD